MQIIQKYSYPKIKLLFFPREIVKLKVKFRKKEKKKPSPDRLFSFVSACLVSQAVVSAVFPDYTVKLLTG